MGDRSLFFKDAGSTFHAVGPETANPRGLKVLVNVRGMMRSPRAAKRCDRSAPLSDTRESISERYGGASPRKQRKTSKVWTRFAAGSEASVTCSECHRRWDRISSSVEPVGLPLAAPTGADRSAGHQPRRADCCSSPICCWWKRGQAKLMPRWLVTDERREVDAAGRSRNDKRGEHGLAWIVDCRRVLQGC